jgi:hypothetical protein
MGNGWENYPEIEMAKRIKANYYGVYDMAKGDANKLKELTISDK